jgi:two-component system LytT family sensor kinase
MWWAVTIGSFSAVANNILFSAYSIKFLFYVVFQAAAVYFNLYFLMPRFLERGKYIQYVLLVVSTIVLAAAIIACGYYAASWASGISFRDMYGKDPAQYSYFFQINTLPSTAAAMTLGLSVKLAKNWVQTKRKQQVLEKEKLETELKFLRSQLNPHFLFNSINSIFVLIHKNPDMASESLAKFSDLLRYQLYECNEPLISLQQELVYLENYIELEKLRQESNMDIRIRFGQKFAGNLAIAPFILIPFIENAFKHVSKEINKRNWITMDLHLDNHELIFSISNSVSAGYHPPQEFFYAGGIGLKNVKRRLDLIYDSKHNLTISHDDHLFSVSLRLHLTEISITEPEMIPARLSLA